MHVYDVVMDGLCGLSWWMNEWIPEVGLLYVWSNVVNFGTHFVSNYFAGGGPCVSSQDHTILQTHTRAHGLCQIINYLIIKMSSYSDSFLLFTLNTNPAIVVPVFTGLGVLLFPSPRAFSNKTFLNDKDTHQDKCIVLQRSWFTFLHK